MEVSVETLCNLLVRGKLLPAEEVKAIYQRWTKEAKESRGDAGQFRKWLVTRSFVTAQQAAQLARWLEQSKPPAPEQPARSTPPHVTAPEATDPFDFGAAPAKPASGKTKEIARAAAIPNPDAPETVDFGLDATQPAPKEEPLPQPVIVRTGLSLRDWLMLAIGAAAVIAAGLLGMLLARATS